MADPETRLYGMADSSNHQAPAENGMRGEGATDAANMAYRREITPPDQPPIVVEETSGVAFAEAGRTADREPRAPSGSTVPWVLVALVLGYAAGRTQWRAKRDKPRQSAPAAMARMPGEPGGFSQVRDAGPEQMRDPNAGWSAVDEASDESFPASDPPSMSVPAADRR